MPKAMESSRMTQKPSLISKKLRRGDMLWRRQASARCILAVSFLLESLCHSKQFMNTFTIGRGVQFDNMKAKKWLNMASINTEDYDSGKDPALSEVSSIELQYVKDRVSCVNFLNMNLHLEMSSGSPFIVSFEYCPFVLDAIPQNICPAE